MAKRKKTIGEAVVVGATLAGAALGAAAVMLSDKKNQKKIKKTVDDLSNEAVELGKTVKKKVEEYINTPPVKEEKPKKNKSTSKAKSSDTKPAKVYTPRSK